MKVTKCTGEDRDSCKRCLDNDKWKVSWMCYLYSIEGHEGCYIATGRYRADCVKATEEEYNNLIERGGMQNES